MQYQVNIEAEFTAKVRKQDLTVKTEGLPQSAVDKIFAYGLQRILNDSSASAKDGAEAIELATKRWESLRNGVIRQSKAAAPADPLKREALRIATDAVRGSKGFAKWLAENGLKAGDKDAKAMLAEKAKELAATEAYIAKAEASLAAVSAIEDVEIDF